MSENMGVPSWEVPLRGLDSIWGIEGVPFILGNTQLDFRVSTLTTRTSQSRFVKALGAHALGRLTSTIEAVGIGAYRGLVQRCATPAPAIRSLCKVAWASFFDSLLTPPCICSEACRKNVCPPSGQEGHGTIQEKVQVPAWIP